MEMKKIPSFTVNHLNLVPGVYVSRTDTLGERTLTTFDLRVTAPNIEPVMNTAEIHTIEHLAATFLRNDMQFQSEIIYFGPMGCRTGFYLIVTDRVSYEEVLQLLIRTFDFIANYKGEIPGATARDCGNYLDQNLPMANYYGKRYLQVLEQLKLNGTTFQYPEDE